MFFKTSRKRAGGGRREQGGIYLLFLNCLKPSIILHAIWVLEKGRSDCNCLIWSWWHACLWEDQPEEVYLLFPCIIDSCDPGSSFVCQGSLKSEKDNCRQERKKEIKRENQKQECLALWSVVPEHSISCWIAF